MTPANRHLEPSGMMPLLDHLRELRRRLLWAAGSVLVFSLIAYAFREQIFSILVLPHHEACVRLGIAEADCRLIYIRLPEAFFVYLKVAVMSGFLASVPVIFYHLWKFIMPGLYANERRYVFPFVLTTTFFFVCGLLFCYFVIFPYALRFFLGQFQAVGQVASRMPDWLTGWIPKGIADTVFAQAPALEAKISVDEYWRFVIKLHLAFGVAFELPIVIFFLARMGLVTPGFLIRNFRYAFLILACASAFFTPPDPFTMMAMLGPLCVLYLLSIGVAYVARRKPAGDDDD